MVRYSGRAGTDMDLVALVRCLLSIFPTVGCSGSRRALFGLKTVGGLMEGSSGWTTTGLRCSNTMRLGALTLLFVDTILFLAMILSVAMTLFVDTGFSFISGCWFRL